MNLRFAFAVNSDAHFENIHFGEAKKFLIYEEKRDGMEFVTEEKNPFGDADHEIGHGDRKKGEAIIGLLKKNNVHVLVSRQFGKNIRLINDHFIPVIVTRENLDEVIRVLNRHLHWIKEEWEHNDSNHKLFTIKSGILKSYVKKK